MTGKEAYRYWMSQNGLTDSGRMAVGYTETSFGINIVLRNGTIIPYPYNYDEYFHYGLLLK